MAVPFWLQNVIGPSLRAGLIAAGSPTPGAVGTIRDAVGGMQAAEADQQQRMDRMESMRHARIQEMRQAEEDERRRTEHEAMLRYRHAQEMSEQAQRDRANRPKEDPEEERLYKFYYDKAKAAGVDNEMAHRQAMAGIGRNTTGWMSPVKSEPPAPVFKNPEEYLTNKYAQEMEALDKQPELDPTFDRGRYLQSEMQKLAVPQARALPQRPPSTAEAAIVGPLYQRIDELQKLGTPQAMAEVEKLRKELRGIMASKKADRAPSTAVIWETDDDGMEEAVVIDKSKLGPTGNRRKPNKKDDPKAEFLKAIEERRKNKPGGGAATSPAPTKVASRADVAAYAAQAGVSESEAQKAFTAKGYTIR